MSEQRLYHGTRAGFRKGGYLFPQAFHGKEQRAGAQAGEENWVFITPDKDLARWYAVNGKGRGQAKVLTVEPIGPVEVGPSPWENEEDQYRCSGARVVDVETVE